MWGIREYRACAFSNMELSRKRNKSKEKQTNTFTPSGTGGKKEVNRALNTSLCGLDSLLVVCHIAGESLQGS